MRERPACAACGLFLVKFSYNFTDTDHFAYDKNKHGKSPFPDLKLTKEHTADGEAPSFGRFGDNLVCNQRCAHALLMQLVKSVGVVDLLGLLPAKAEPRKRDVKRYVPSEASQRDQRREWNLWKKKFYPVREESCQDEGDGMRGYCYACGGSRKTFRLMCGSYVSFSLCRPCIDKADRMRS